MLRKTGLVLAAAAALFVGSLVGGIIGNAQEVVAVPVDTTVDVGGPLYLFFRDYILPIFGSVLALIIGWAQFRLTGIRQDAEARASIEIFATNAAGEFLSRFDSIKGMKIDVHNALIAQLANQALTRIPDGLARFGWTAEQVKQRIVEKIGVLTAAGTSTEVTTEVVTAAPRPSGS